MKDVFLALREILKRFQSDLDAVVDNEEEYYVNSRVTEKGKPVFFGMVKIRKSAVSYHLMPVYCHPRLLDDASPELKRSMQGKSCFQLSTLDSKLISEIELLTERGFEAFKAEGRI